MFYSAEIPIHVTYDDEANAAYIEFSQGSHQRTLPIKMGDCHMAVLSIDDTGILRGLELLNPRVQLLVATQWSHHAGKRHQRQRA